MAIDQGVGVGGVVVVARAVGAKAGVGEEGEEPPSGPRRDEGLAQAGEEEGEVRLGGVCVVVLGLGQFV